MNGVTRKWVATPFWSDSIVTARERSVGQDNMFTGVCLSTGGCLLLGGCLVQGDRCLLPGGLVWGWVPAPGGGLVSGGVPGLGGWGVPGGDCPPPMATAAGSTHPTGMHSCFQ